ncbi:hypothetical protein [Corynebacterium pseudotuberculosis]|nr:hypothetical protein [Corynebacterium pseudotuberculosis]ATB61493.1 Hypothetical protein BFF96_0601 [Corynebacterium pseudotuberculosis]AUY59989.1 Hypothetical protein BFG00_0601 [Corynebacterium pseudotuberculosis]VTQ69821.1 Uncharacterised protein [Corynebacterium pseudotuberculosis]
MQYRNAVSINAASILAKACYTETPAVRNVLDHAEDLALERSL